MITSDLQQLHDRCSAASRRCRELMSAPVARITSAQPLPGHFERLEDLRAAENEYRVAQELYDREAARLRGDERPEMPLELLVK